MANGQSDEPIDPLSGRILGAGSNNLQRSIDSLDFTLQRLLALSGAGGAGGGGRPPVVIPASPMGPQNGGNRGALVLRGQALPSPAPTRFPAATSWTAQQAPPTYQWGTPVRNGPGNQLPSGTPVPNYPPRPNYPPMPNYPPGADDFNWRNAAWNGRRASNAVGRWGSGLVKMGIPMDTYSQWAGIANSAPYSSDGTNGGSVNAIRRFVFGSRGQNLTGWAQDVEDAQKAAFTVSRNSGYTELTPGTRQSINPAFANYLGNVKDLSILNPTMNAAQTASMMGTLTSVRGLYTAQMYGYRPLLSPGGRVDRNALSGFADSVMKRTFSGKGSIRPEELKASLGQNGSLHANIAAYVKSAGGDESMVQALEDYITGRNTAQQRGLASSEFDKLLADYQKGGKAGEAAEKRLQKFGVSNTILQSQKDLSAAKAGSVSDLMDTLGPAVKRANEALETFYHWLNDIVATPGVKETLGTLAGWGSVFGPAVGSAFGAMAGMRMGAGGLAAAGSLMGMRTVGGGAVRSPGLGFIGASGRGGSLMRGGAYGAGALAVGAAGSAITDQIDNPTGKKWAGAATGAATYGLAGAAFGSMLAPGIGTAVGGAVGAVYGGLTGWFSKDSTTGYDGRDGGNPNKKSGKGAVATEGHAIAGKAASGAISAALEQVGKPYIWGGTGPDGFDCSGLVQYAYKQIGVRLPRVSQDQMNVGKRVKQEDVRPGDLLFPHAGHVAMYIGGGKIVEAPRPGKNIRTAPMSSYSSYKVIRRIVGAVGSYSADGDQDDNTQKDQDGNLGGDSGSMVLNDNYGSAEEADAIAAAMAGSRHTLLNTPMNDSSSEAASDEESLEGDAPSVPSNAKNNVKLGKQMAAQKGWTGKQWDALYRLWMGESGWRHDADNPTSDAYGIPQSLPGSKMASEGRDWRTNPRTQIAWGLKYIKGRYGTPLKAWNFWNRQNPHWYDTGAWEIPHDQPAIVHKGEMIIEKPKADTIRQALMRDVVNMKDAATGKTSSGGGGGGSITLNFHPGSVQFAISGAMSESSARRAADSFSKALAENERLKALAAGL